MKQFQVFKQSPWGYFLVGHILTNDNKPSSDKPAVNWLDPEQMRCFGLQPLDNIIFIEKPEHQNN